MEKKASFEHVEITVTEAITEDEYWPLSGLPFCDLILGRTSVNPPYDMHVSGQMVSHDAAWLQYLHKKMNKELPDAGAPAVLTCNGKEWEMVYQGVKNKYRFSRREWRKFVVDNNLKEGDGLVFELSECSTSKPFQRFLEVISQEILN